MTTTNKYWTILIILLLVIIAVGSLVIWSKYRPNQPIEIYVSPSPEIQGKVHVSGTVSNPGFYPLKTGDSIDDIIRAAGGISTGADLNQLKLYIPMVGEEEPPQKININRAETWLLQALPGIGEVRAQAIIDHRQQNGRFHNINELINVEGIGVSTFEKFKHLITVAD
jgi:competence protein ComEA